MPLVSYSSLHQQCPGSQCSTDAPGHAFSDSFSDSLAAALRFLSYRPRTIEETRKRLARKYNPDTVERTLAYLLDSRFLDDADFARQWRNSRERRRPKGSRALKIELKRLGVSETIIDDTLDGIDETGNARKAALRPAARMVDRGCTREDFRRKMGDFLARRGFAYGVIKETIEELWQDLNRESGLEPLPGEEYSDPEK